MSTWRINKGPEGWEVLRSIPGTTRVRVFSCEDEAQAAELWAELTWNRTDTAKEINAEVEGAA